VRKKRLNLDTGTLEAQTIAQGQEMELNEESYTRVCVSIRIEFEVESKESGIG
jgi:hypothetical protein